MKPGTLVHDAETDEDADIYIVGQHPLDASNARMGSGESVADVNPDYPEGDAVYLCVYTGAMDMRFGYMWWDWDPAYIAWSIGRDDDENVKTYVFPESRLEPAEDEEGTDDEDIEQDHPIVDEVPARDPSNARWG